MRRSPEVQIESQMRFREILGQLSMEGLSHRHHQPSIGPYLTISRQTGSGGSDVADSVGRKFGWSVLDRQLVSDLAARLKLEPRLLSLMDEARSGWWRETLLNLMNSRLILQDNYVEMLSKVILIAAAEGKVIIIGRGGHRILREGAGLRVRIVADDEDRIKRIAAREKLDRTEAISLLTELDRARADFIRRHFHCNVDNPQDYDLVINTSAIGIHGTSELIAKAVTMLPGGCQVATAEA